MTVSRGRRRLAGLATACAVACCWGAGARDATAARFALLVGNNDGQAGDAPLRFAESDTLQLAQLLTRLGGFTPGGTVVVLGRSGDDVRRALADLARRLAAQPGEHLAVVYYSGHADAQALHTGSSALALAELRESMRALPAATRILIVDACQAGVLTRAKGGQPGPGFELTAGEGAQGLAVLASSAASELAQESDQLGGSVFTHFLRGGLSGLADRNRDGNVSLSEVFQYTAEHTLAATLGTSTGPQHPTYRLDLSGREDLILTRPGVAGAGYGHLHLDVPGWYFVRRRDGTIAAELVSRGGETLALETGAYEVTRREPRSLEVARLDVEEGRALSISRARGQLVPFGQMVRKGQGPPAAYGLLIASAVRTAVADLGPSLGALLAARAELPALTAELRLGLARASQQASHLASQTWDLAASVAGLRVFDLGAPTRGSHLSLAGGIEAGASYLMQQLDDGERRRSLAPFAAPLLLSEISLGRRLFLRAEVRVPFYVLRVRPGSAGETRWQPALAASLGAGVAF